MTSAAVDDRLTGRVAARIAEGRASRVRWTWTFIPIAAAAALILAVLSSRREPAREDIAPRGTDITVASAPAPEPAVSRTRIPVTRPIVPIDQAPAPPLAPIEIDPIAVGPLVETNAIQITPIAIDRIDISPMP